MSIVEISEFDEGVSEFKTMEREIAKDFLQGIIKLGEILKRQRELWKPKGQWTKYLETVGKHLSAANQFIRIYDYSIKNMKQLMDVSLTNWNKVNMFLALPTEVRDELSKVVGGEDLPTDTFREKIAEVDVSKAELVPESELPIDTGWEELITASSTVDAPFMANQLLESFKKEGKDFSKHCLPVATAYVELIRLTVIFKKEASLKNLTPGEKDFWNKLIKSQVNALLSTI